MIENIPQELRQLPQWVVAGPSREPLNPRTGGAASVIDSSTWGTFEEAVRAGFKHIGFVLTVEAGLTIIDLDNKLEKPATEEQLARHTKILDAFDSYTERSTSGRGYHIIVRGTVPAAVHRDNVEVYSTGRYMICTGDVVRQAPIVNYQDLLVQLCGEMRPNNTIELVEYDEILDDVELVEMAMNAVNADKFNDLCNGEWLRLGYPSQSEGDLALLSILAFYSKSNEQCRRLFRQSALGKREKALRNDKYIDYALEKIRAKQPPPIDFSQLNQESKHVTNGVPQATVETPSLSLPHEPVKALNARNRVLPPGLIGEMAQYFYQTAVRPVPDIALAASIGLAAGVVGRSYNISNQGLNQYLILVARTGTGKEGAASGINNLIQAVRSRVPMVDQFIGPSAFASGQALIKRLDEQPCFLSILGEFGLTLQQLCDPNATAAQIMLRKALLDLYSKSGWNQILRSSVYSDIEKNTKMVQAPNVTILGETTPETFFDGLDISHISDGLIPRFNIIEYSGNRPARNQWANAPPPDLLVQKFADLVTIALTTMNNKTCQPVGTDREAQNILNDFDLKCDSEINNAHNAAESQIWNRAHLKALKLGALLSVGVNPHQPTITAEIANWCIDFVQEDVNAMTKRFKSGDVGKGDSKLGADLKRVIEIYLRSSFEEVEFYGAKRQMFVEKVIPYNYLMRKTAALASFRHDRRGSTAALKSALQDLCDSNMLIEVPSIQLFSRYGTRGKAWMVGPAWTS